MSPSPRTSAKTSAPTEADLTDAILRRWPLTTVQPRHIAAVQVNNGAGHSYTRRLDVVVFDTWPSKGLKLHGLEIKTTKRDLYRELQNPQKFEAFEPHLDLFSIVAPRGIVDLTLLPKKWGLIVLGTNGQLKTRRRPLPLQDSKRRTVSRSFAAAFIRALVDRSLSHEQKVAEYNRGYEAGARKFQERAKNLQHDLDRWKKGVAEFEEVSGLRIDAWSAGRIGEAVDLVMRGGIQHRIRFAPDVRKLGEKLLELADQLDALQLAFDETDEGDGHE